MRILITGVAGTGKSTIISEIAKTGRKTIDLDHGGICQWVNKKTGKITSYAAGAEERWIAEHRWECVIPKLVVVLNKIGKDDDVFVGGKITSRQIPEMAKIFDTIYLLKPSNSTVDSRLKNRISNKDNFAKSQKERGHIVANRKSFEDVCIKAGAIVLDNNSSPQEVVDQILKFNTKNFSA
ncbi:MAG: hypothetical protein Q7S34_04445 [bacterium]|nr:hypothetical protein [bacterium]